MAYEQRDMSGSLFANEQRTDEKHANARGSALIDGVSYWVDAYTRTTGEGKKWQSLTFKKKEKQTLPKAATASPKAPATAFQDDTDSDIPW